MKNHYVYLITNLINNKKYIGKRSCSCDIDQDTYLGSGVAITKAIKKYGRDSFKKEILAICNTEDEAYQKEREIIEATKAYSNKMYYNIAFGGLGNTHDFHPTKEAIKKGLETKKKNGTLPIGKKNGMFGRYNYENKCKKIICIPMLGDIIIFPSFAEASRYFNISYKRISQGCNRNSIVSINNDFYYFLSYDDYAKIKNKTKYIKDKQDYLRNYSINKEKLKIFYEQKEVYQINIETIKIIRKYNNIRSITKENGIDTNRIARCVKHKSNCATKGYSYIFADEYNKLTKDEIYNLYHFKRSDIIYRPRPDSRTSVYCLTTNQKFESVQEAIDYFNLSKGTKIASVCKGQRQYAGRHPITNKPLVWQYYEDYINGIFRFYLPKDSKYINKDVETIINNNKKDENEVK